MEHLAKFRPIHPFPARMAPSIALNELPVAGEKSLRVLDPMAGSGTTLVAARTRGHQAYGFDTDPLALLIADVWCADINKRTILAHAQAAQERARLIVRQIKQGEAYPKDADTETKEFVRYWFDPTNRRQLRALADAIDVVRNSATRKILWCAFSRLIIAKARGASLAMDLSHSRPHKVSNKPVFRPLPDFLRAVNTVLDNSPFAEKKSSAPDVAVCEADARALPLPESSVDIVITSPPYLNAIDYLRCHKFSLVWMGHRIPDLRKLRSDNIGTEVSSEGRPDEPGIKEALEASGDVYRLRDRDRRMLAKYAKDMEAVLKEINRVLEPNGRCVLVVGDCTMRGVFVRNSEVLKKLGEQIGLTTEKVQARELPANRRYLPPPARQTPASHCRGACARKSF